MKTKEDIAAEAYQIIGSLASSTGTFDNTEVIRALDYFWAIANEELISQSNIDILPWGLEHA